MNKEKILKILEEVRDKKIPLQEGYNKLKELPYYLLNDIRFDIHRKIRRGVPEVVYGEGKDENTLIHLVENFIKKKENLLITRLSEEKAEKIKNKFSNAQYDPISKTLRLINKKIRKKGRNILILAAGTSDMAVAREAFICSEFFGNNTELVVDVGIAGIHRVFDIKEKIDKACCIIVVAGMEGALPSFIAALTDKPVIGVPTDVGYGANLSGFTALFGMLCNCSAGVAVVNINNGFGAAYFATLINNVRGID